MRSGLSALVTLLLIVGACAPGSSDGDGGPNAGDRTGPIDFLRFVQDRPAVGGDWYLYEEDAGHLLTPFAHAYVVRDGQGANARYAAARIVTYYDEQTGDSGLFTLRYRVFGGGWQAEQEWVSSKNIKSDGPVCFDLHAGAEVDCAGDGWQLMLRTYAFLAREGPIVVSRPGLFVRSAADRPDAGDVRVATLEGRDTLDGLPNPTTLGELDDAPADGWTEMAWDFSRYSSNLPAAGMVLGDRAFGDGFVATGDALLVLNAQRLLSRVQLTPVTEGAPDDGVRIEHAQLEVELLDNSIANEWPDAVVTEVDAPALGETRYLSFSEEGLVTEPDDASPPHLPPRESTWDLALVRVEADHLRVLLSPGSALYNATALDDVTSLADVTPPLE